MAAYVGAYFVLVSPASSIYMPSTGNLDVSPGYGKVPAEIFAPIHLLDRKVFRPKMWSFPGTSDEYIHYMGWDR